MFKCDYHTHTDFSFDGAPDASVDALCRAAIDAGVTDLAITDHFESNWSEVGAESPYDADTAHIRIAEAQERYRGKLYLTYGIEIGQANQYPEEAKRLLESHPFEFVICSLHNLTGAPDFYYMDFEKLMRDSSPFYVGSLFEKYVDELSQALDVLPSADTVGHLTYMHRYCALSGHDYDFSRHFHKVEQLYRKMIAREIALEVNVSTLCKGLGFAMPDRALLSLYRDCSGRLVTVGTDSHAPAHVGQCVEEGLSLLRSVGLDQVLVVRRGERTVITV